jgi:uncharacterized protein involved in outer membrane biogenesis
MWFVILIAVIAGLSLSALYMLADPNKMKPVIADEVFKRTGYKLVIDGNLSWSLYPQVGLKAAHVTLTAPGQKRAFLDMKGMHVAVELSQLLHGINKLSGEVHITDVTMLNVRANSALVGLHWQDNILTLRPIQASLYNGSMSGMARGKDFSTTPAWNWDVTLSHVDIKPLLRDANGDHSRLKVSGTGQVRINASTQGSVTQEMISNLNGVTDFNITNGIVEGVDLNYLLITADALLNRKAIELPQNINQTAFDSLAGSMLITNGLAQTNNLLLISSTFKVKGQGNYNLPRKSLDLALLLESQKELMTQWQIPVLISGEVSKPDVRLDMREINKQIASEQIDKVKEKVKNKIKDIANNLLGE